MFNLIPRQQNTEPLPIFSDIIKNSKRLVNFGAEDFICIPAC